MKKAGYIIFIVMMFFGVSLGYAQETALDATIYFHIVGKKGDMVRIYDCDGKLLYQGRLLEDLGTNLMLKTGKGRRLVPKLPYKYVDFEKGQIRIHNADVRKYRIGP